MEYSTKAMDYMKPERTEVDHDRGKVTYHNSRGYFAVTRDFPDQQFEPEIYKYFNPKCDKSTLDMDQVEKFKRTADVDCLFCGKKHCIYFMLRDSFYKSIAQSWNDAAIYDKTKNYLSELAPFKGDIFMGLQLKDLDPERFPNYKQYLDFITEWRQLYYPGYQYDYNFLEFNKQLEHEAKVRDYIHKNKLTEVVVDGETFKFDQNSFKIEFDFSIKARPCQACDNNKCIDKYESVQEYFRFKVHEALKGAGLKKGYMNDDEMMRIENWTHISNQKGLTWWFWESEGQKVKVSFPKLLFTETRLKHDKVNKIDGTKVKPEKGCEVCYKPAPNFCSRCGQARYCTVNHQRLDWPKHKKVCAYRNHEAVREPQEL